MPGFAGRKEDEVTRYPAVITFQDRDPGAGDSGAATA
jgi:hypothetical protein